MEDNLRKRTEVLTGLILLWDVHWSPSHDLHSNTGVFFGGGCTSFSEAMGNMNTACFPETYGELVNPLLVPSLALPAPMPATPPHSLVMLATLLVLVSSKHPKFGYFLRDPHSPGEAPYYSQGYYVLPLQHPSASPCSDYMERRVQWQCQLSPSVFGPTRKKSSTFLFKGGGGI